MKKWGVAYKWDAAIREIEGALGRETAEIGVRVEVEYHRKWSREEHRFGYVEKIAEYEYEGKTHKDVMLWHDILQDNAHVIDRIITDEFRK